MYIKSVIIDGFKSYGRRTEIHGFDSEFTAITGLNGTGKSNILDSICFVLGIMNLGQVRASSLQELVYKSGQAGIIKATVTLIFDNTDPLQRPMGYDKCREISITRQIVVGGKNKYLINGKLVQNKKISDFFCSVQLNVNNPNFLIMQGRITKVLNMKPQEILSMIEEAAGTSMYETKREATNKLIEKKDAKVREANTLLEEEVVPKLEKLRQERSAYLEYQKICRDIEYLNRICVSYRYLKHKEAARSIETHLEKLSTRIQTCRNTIIENDKKCTEIDEAYKAKQQEIDDESSGELKAKEDELNTVLTAESNATGCLKKAMAAIDQEQKKLKAIEKNIESDEKVLKQKHVQLEKVKDLFQTLKEADVDDTRAYEEAQRKHDAVSKGLSTGEDGEARSLQDQMIITKNQLSEAQTVIKTAAMELSHCRNVLNQKESEVKSNDAAYTKDKQLNNQLIIDMGKLRKQIDDIGYENGAFEQMEQRRTILQNEIRELKQQQYRLNASRYELQYRDPIPNFDRSKMCGMVGKLITVPNPKNYLALMVTAGGSLYSYVTEDETSSRLILQKGQLKQRVTIIPITKVSPHPLRQSVIDAAQRLVGKENVQSALSVIQYDKRYTPVMQFVFGHTLICRDLSIARQVTFNRNVLCRSVTLEGDIVDPEGTLSGGSRPRGSNILQDLAEIKRLEYEIHQRSVELQQIEKMFSTLQQQARTFKKLNENLELLQHEFEANRKRLDQTNFQQQQDEIIAAKERIKSLEDDLKEARDSQNTLQAKVKEIVAKLSDAKGYRENELKVTAEAMQSAKIKSEKSRKRWKEHEQQFETLQLEIKELETGISNGHEENGALMRKLTEMKANIEQLQQTSSLVSNDVAKLKASIKEQKDKINSQNKELKNYCIEKDRKQKQNQELTLEIKKKENEEIKVRTDNQQAFKKITDLELKYNWITEDFEYFGRKNTRYDYSKEDPVAASQKLNTMREQKEQMERGINMRAMLLLEREEEQYQETMRRKKIVEMDKEKIKRIICKMDERKSEKVEKAWCVVNENFGSIFSTLLQGAHARLNPVKVGDELVGLEIKVGFNGIWKESLGELSGGQRSLVALSLVLAMLKFSPAPLYILDEVDAALDMSHTQNIGNMLKSHFTSSQFIIVSLKDGMFNNANVLFRTKFEEGVSMVTRTINPKIIDAGKG